MMKKKLFLLLTLFTCHCNAYFPNYEFLKQVTGQSQKELEAAVKWIDWYWDYVFHGWENYYHVLPRLINQYKLEVGCEIGVAYGTHSEHILKNTSIKKLYSIDPYQHFEEGYIDSMNYPQKYLDVLFYKAMDLLASFGTRSTLLRMQSVEAANQFYDHELDFVFIDANHSYEGVKADLNAWYNKIRSGGLLSGDDYLPDAFPGVIQAVNEFFNAKGLEVHQDVEQPRIWWVIKPL